MRVLVVEDDTTLKHGGMTFGAGVVAARAAGAASIVDPSPHAVASIAATYEKYPHMTEILPAMGYGAEQMSELEDTINATDCDIVLIGTPIDLARLLKIKEPAQRVRYELDSKATAALREIIEKKFASA